MMKRSENDLEGLWFEIAHKSSLTVRIAVTMEADHGQIVEVVVSRILINMVNLAFVLH